MAGAAVEAVTAVVAMEVDRVDTVEDKGDTEVEDTAVAATEVPDRDKNIVSPYISMHLNLSTVLLVSLP